MLPYCQHLQFVQPYQYYQAKQIERRIGDDERLQENLPPGLVDFNQRVSVNFEEFFNENEFNTRKVFKFPSDKVEKFEEIICFLIFTFLFPDNIFR